MNGEWASRKTIVIAGGILVFTLAWAFFLDQLGITPDTLLISVGNIQSVGFILSLPFALFVLFFSLTISLITATADKDERGRVYVGTIIPSIIACAIGAILFSKFAQWYPLALFYFGAIPLMIETSRMKRLELKNFVVFRSSFAGAQRGMQILGIGVLVTLSIVAIPQSQNLYSQFEDALFQGKIVQQLNLQTITSDFLITTQRNTLVQVMETQSFSQLRDSTDPDVIQFVTLMDQTLQNVNSPNYKDKIDAQVEEQQKKINTDVLISQIQKSVPGYKALHDFYWAIAAFMGTMLFILIATFILQPLSAVFGTLLYLFIPSETYENENTDSTNEKEDNTGGYETLPSSAPPTVPQQPTYTHTEETPT
ncbi:MAG: hypothetical protein V1776_03945 [Candidatus Diapherotrites archaeon]